LVLVPKVGKNNKLAPDGILIHCLIYFVHDRGEDGEWLRSDDKVYLAAMLKHVHWSRPEDITTAEDYPSE
jgi:hypothetical protein